MAEAVTLEAQSRTREFQRVLVDGAVRIMAVQTVLAHRRMLEQERTALFRMALVAGLVDRIGLEQRAGQGAMRIVAVVATHLSFRQRQMRTAIDLQPDVLMALRAGIVDRGLCHQTLHGEFCHGVVTVAARQVVALVD